MSPWHFLPFGADHSDFQSVVFLKLVTCPAGTAWGEIEQVNSGDANLVTADGLARKDLPQMSCMSSSR